MLGHSLVCDYFTVSPPLFLSSPLSPQVARASEIAATALNAFTQTSFASSKDLSKLEKRRKNEEKKERERMEAAMKMATVSRRHLYRQDDDIH